MIDRKDANHAENEIELVTPWVLNFIINTQIQHKCSQNWGYKILNVEFLVDFVQKENVETCYKEVHIL